MIAQSNRLTQTTTTEIYYLPVSQHKLCGIWIFRKFLTIGTTESKDKHKQFQFIKSYSPTLSWKKKVIWKYYFVSLIQFTDKTTCIYCIWHNCFSTVFCFCLFVLRQQLTVQPGQALLPYPSKSWDYRHVTPNLVFVLNLEISFSIFSNPTLFSIILYRRFMNKYKILVRQWQHMP